MASDNSDFDKQDYWEERYKVEDNFEWCCNLRNVSDMLTPRLEKGFRILVLGCGNSAFSADLYAMGYHNITNIDYSSTVIENMANKYSELSGMSWQTMDMFDLGFPEHSFDCVLEKCTFEVLFVKEKDPWNTSEETVTRMNAVMQQISKVLRPGGELLSISFTQPHFRLPLFRMCCPAWNFEYKTFGQLFHYFFYIGISSTV
ncbi:putative Endothelin-converting enzyme 2 [Hypsibius exemplaris]|uniref:Endothelin-converting enzyme 2 n=1 Tax=Hypsibius exemplaris TaxID=2072580 RepID=A0A1W0XAG9_HYPEX|nr:putative Endothelin-converting enzyme 2 [Hypsibius exemplaris]